MATFDDREKSFEHKYKHDKELEFKVNARRNKLLGLWAAAELGLTGGDAEAYAKSVVMADLEKPGDEDVVEKVVADFTAKGIEMTPHRVRKHMADLLPKSSDELHGTVAVIRRLVSEQGLVHWKKYLAAFAMMAVAAAATLASMTMIPSGPMVVCR